MARFFFTLFHLDLTFFRLEFPFKTKRKLKKASYVKLVQAMFTLYRIGFCSVPKRSHCEHRPCPLCNLQRSVLI